MLQLVITYIWFGATIPEFYLTQFTDRQYPIQILINPVPSRVVASLELDIQKADRYKLEVLKDGGVYSDFDNRIDYECLMKKIEEVESDYNNETVLEMLVMRYEGQHWQNRIATNFIYVPHKNTKLIHEILQNSNDRQCNDSISNCFGGEMLNNYRHRIRIQNLDSCISHDFDWSWWSDSNKILGANRKPKEKLKLMKQIAQLGKNNQQLNQLLADLKKKQSTCDNNLRERDTQLIFCQNELKAEKESKKEKQDIKNIQDVTNMQQKKQREEELNTYKRQQASMKTIIEKDRVEYESVMKDKDKLWQKLQQSRVQYNECSQQNSNFEQKLKNAKQSLFDSTNEKNILQARVITKNSQIKVHMQQKKLLFQKIITNNKQQLKCQQKRNQLTLKEKELMEQVKQYQNLTGLLIVFLTIAGISIVVLAIFIMKNRKEKNGQKKKNLNEFQKCQQNQIETI